MRRAQRLLWPFRSTATTQIEHGAVASFDLQPTLELAIWKRDDLAHDAGIANSSRSSTEFGIGYTLPSERGVHMVMESAKKAGAKIVKRAQKAFWGGYTGYFQDPDDHLWEIVFNPEYA